MTNNYMGCFDRDKLVAVIDFIMRDPKNDTSFIVFFMTDVFIQNKGVGSIIMTDSCAYLSRTGILRIKLGWVKGNSQAEHFSKKRVVYLDLQLFTYIVSRINGIV